MASDTGTITTLEEAHRFITDCLKAVGTPQNHADIVAENLVQADYRGHYSHGMNRLEFYINDITSGRLDPNSVCHIEKQNAATALVNGRNGLGAVVGNFCMDLAIEKATTAGIGIVVAHGSNHYGIAGIYALQAVKRGYIGMSFTNTSPCMVPTRARDAALGTNPLSFGAPTLHGDSFVLDMATTAVAMGKVEIEQRKGLPIPEGWALNDRGEVETNAEEACNASRLTPLGGAEIQSGYKGYGLAIMVEILSGILSGSAYGPNIRRWGVGEDVADLGHAFVAIDPDCFASGFEDRLSDLMGSLRSMEPVDRNQPVLVPGDPERIHMRKVDKEKGLSYVRNQHEANAKLAKNLKVKPMVYSTV